jgi:hypothetical protein
LKTQPKQLLGYLLLAFVPPASVFFYIVKDRHQAKDFLGC